MKLLWAAAIFVAAGGQAWAQSATAIGTGVGVAKSNSKSEAVAISGQGGGGGTGVGLVNQGGISPQAVVTSTVPSSQSIKTVPTVFAPGLTAAGIESCLGSLSGGGSWLGTGISLGGTIPDKDCSARLDARTLWAFGLKKAAVARLCLSPDIYRSMPEVCVTYLPAPPVGYGVSSVDAAYGAAYETTSYTSYSGGDIWLVEGATGKNRLCKDYDVTQKRCRSWAHLVSRPAAAKKRLLHTDKVTPTVASPAEKTAASEKDKS